MLPRCLLQPVPTSDAAAVWSADTLKAMGLDDVHREPQVIPGPDVVAATLRHQEMDREAAETQAALLREPALPSTPSTRQGDPSDLFQEDFPPSAWRPDGFDLNS
ncbi:hypothetical protein H0H87_008368, partial [Tephrocybe sp. NHM501043]